MLIRDVVEKIWQQLGEKYSETEIDSFVHILFKHYLNMTSFEIHFMQDNDMPNEAEQQILEAVGDLEKYRPIQYILGKTEFYELQFELTPDVLIPRPETEEIVDWIVCDCENEISNTSLSFIDIGTGSGCIAISLKANFPNSEVWAVDISEPALSVAKRNAAKNNVEINFIKLDVLNNDMMSYDFTTEDRNTKAFDEVYLQQHFGKFDIIVSNPPYVTPSEKSQMQPNVLDYEPHNALFTPDDDPLIFFKHIAAFGIKKLKDNGKIFFEINEQYHAEVADILKQNGFSDISLRKDINGKWRMISARPDIRIL